MPGTNLTRDEAAARARCSRSSAYDVDPRPDGRRRRPSGPRRRSGSPATRPGASTFVDLIAPRVHEVVLNGRSLPVGRGRVATAGSRCRDLAARERAARRRRRRLHAHRRGPAPLRRPGRRGGLPLQPVRGRRRAAGVRLLRPARPQGDVHVHGHRAGPLAGRLGLAGRPSRRRPATASPTWRFEPTPRLSTYVTALVAGPYHAVHERADGAGRPHDPARRVLPPLAGRAPRRRRRLRHHPRRASPSSSDAFDTATRSPSTTSSSCRSSTPARWRTPAR